MNTLSRVFEVFWVFLRLGCIAFGGPTAHFGYFEATFVRKLKWISEETYAELLALCQFLPGPGSSQVGFAIGLKRAGVLGAFAAWVGFTAPAAVLMIAFAFGMAELGGGKLTGWIDGLLVAAVAVVANAIWNMAKKLCPEIRTQLIAGVAAVALIVLPYASLQVLVILLGGLLGVLLFRKGTKSRHEGEAVGSTLSGAIYLGFFFVGLLGLPLLATAFPGELLQIADAFYRAGSLVFGGGHVVLPLLDSYTVQRDWIEEDLFLAGYGAAQAIPGPLFAFTAFLGAKMDAGWSGVSGGVFALVWTYVPAWLLVLGALPLWERIREVAWFRLALKGVNASVVGILVAAFYDPVLLKGVQSWVHALLASVAFVALKYAKAPPLFVVAAAALIGAVLL